jgi:hypothetical protein
MGNGMNIQLPLGGFGPEAGDQFCFTWWNIAEGARVWIEHRGRWRAGILAGLGRSYVEVESKGRGGRRHRVRKSDSELRRRR